MRRAIRRAVLLGAMLLAAGGCQRQDDTRTTLVVQRFFGECGAVYGASLDVARAETECGILTTLINRFRAENPDVRVRVNVVAWPGYPQLSAQIAAGDPPDLVTMHQSVISDYSARGLLQPLDRTLAQAGLSAADFTEAGRRGAVKQGQVFALPWDTIGGLFHIDTALMAQAGLMRGGRPVLPRSPAELLEQARGFKARTGKPYLIQAQVNDPATHVRNLYTFLMARGETIFADARHVRLDTPAAREIVTLLRTLYAERLTTRDQDFSAATQSFTNGQGGIFPVGTWMIGPYVEESRTPGRPLYRAYAVTPYPRLWGQDAAFVDGHAWVVPRHARSAGEERAIARFLGFMARHNADWTRTGHLPAMRAVLDMPAFRAQPHRAEIAAMAATGQQLPDYVQRQSAIQGLIAEELEAAITGLKPVDTALRDAQRRVDELLGQMMAPPAPVPAPAPAR